MGNTACGGKRGVVKQTITCGGARNITQVVTCTGGRSIEEEETIKLFTAPGKDFPRTYDPLTYTESIESSFSPLNQAIFLLASPYHYDRIVGALMVDELTDDAVCTGMFFWILHLRYCRTTDYSDLAKSIQSKNKEWMGIPKPIKEHMDGKIKPPVDVEENSSGAEYKILLDILIVRAQGSWSVFHSLYFCLKSETSYNGDVPSEGALLAEAMIDKLLTAMENGGHTDMVKKLESQESVIKKMVEIYKKHKKKKIGATTLNRLLKEDVEMWKGLEGEWYPIGSHGKITGVIVDAIHVYPSSCYPVKVQFKIDPNQSEKKKSAPPEFGTVPTDFTKGLIFKCGDDLRQDNFVMGFCKLVYEILKNAGVDVIINTYEVVALDQDAGAVEEVAGAMSIRSIRDTYSNWAVDYLEGSLQENMDATMDKLVRSCAGSSLFSYILGIGDRHLDNIMMTKGGIIFQVDFGYILGKDPHVHKYKPPKIRLDECVVHALGGASSKYFKRMEALCLRGFIALRRASSILIRAIYHLRHSNLPSMIDGSKFETRIKRIKKLLMWRGQSLPEGENSAILRFQDILDDSRQHIVQPLVEVLHVISTNLNL